MRDPVLCRGRFLQYENIVPDYNFGTLIRADCTKDYAQDNTVLGQSRHCVVEQRPRLSLSVSGRRQSSAETLLTSASTGILPRRLLSSPHAVPRDRSASLLDSPLLLIAALRHSY
jgi:hypothetical protein